VNAKAESILKRSISHGLFEHIIGFKSVGQIWTNLDGLFNKKDVTRLQLLENELANTTPGDLSISQFFLKITNLCSKISALDSEEPVSEARMKWHIIRVLKWEHIPYVHPILSFSFCPLTSSKRRLVNFLLKIKLNEYLIGWFVYYCLVKSIRIFQMLREAHGEIHPRPRISSGSWYFQINLLHISCWFRGFHPSL
jgi:hypothetical protein